MKSLVIAEKPSVGRDIARVLNCKKSGDGCLEGEKYVVTWASWRPRRLTIRNTKSGKWRLFP